jgi:putative ABC transport system permease protein
MSDPSIMIADEPTGNLDVKNGLKVMNIFKELANSGKTILMVTHNPEYFEFADRIIFMMDGRIRKDVKVTKSNVNTLKDEIIKDIETFVDNAGKESNEEPIRGPEPVLHEESLPKGRDKLLQVLDCLKFVVVFTFLMFLLFLIYIPAYLIERLIFRKSNISGKASDFIMKVFNKLEGKKKSIKESISSWNLGEISLSHLMEKKSRTLITILGVGVGIGFITFLLSLGYGLENLVVGEIAEIEEMRQISVNPIVGSEVVLDEEKYEMISSMDGVLDSTSLINVATTVFYADSQTDVVAYGVDSDYLDITRSTFIKGETFNVTENEIVIEKEVLSILGIEEEEIIGKTLEIEFIPVDQEKEQASEEDVQGVYENRIKYNVVGIIAKDSGPVIFFPIEQAQNLGIEDYSEVLVGIDENVDMATLRRDIETLGMETSSVMDTVTEIEKFFKYLRIGLTVVGAIAFLIAVLGMINTLTVSLMERTREVGLLKSIGMKSEEVRKLFITESMLIAFFGGVSGVLMGGFWGLISSLVLSSLSISQGGDYLAISKIPILLIVGIVFVSVLIGFLTGLYPSRRAVKMSPLDALRYE